MAEDCIINNIENSPKKYMQYILHNIEPTSCSYRIEADAINEAIVSQALLTCIDSIILILARVIFLS